MPIYEYYCPSCRTRFERKRPMVEAAATARCEEGHEAGRALSMFATARAGSGPEEFAMPSGGGCACGGGGCGCGH